MINSKSVVKVVLSIVDAVAGTQLVDFDVKWPDLDYTNLLFIEGIMTKVQLNMKEYLTSTPDQTGTYTFTGLFDISQDKNVDTVGANTRFENLSREQALALYGILLEGIITMNEEAVRMLEGKHPKTKALK